MIVRGVVEELLESDVGDRIEVSFTKDKDEIMMDVMDETEVGFSADDMNIIEEIAFRFNWVRINVNAVDNSVYLRFDYNEAEL